MEESDLELIRRLVHQNAELKTLVEEHEGYESQLGEMASRPYLSTADQVERKRIQKLKLAGKDRIEKILNQYRS